MAISTGFYKKIYQWLINEDKDKVLFRPFITDGNPYKSRIFLVGSNAIMPLKVEANSEHIFAEALVSHALLQDMYQHELLQAPRELKGSLQFSQWLQQYGESVVYTALNAYQVENVEEIKRLKKEDPVNFKRGQMIFCEVLEEFKPEIIVLQGASAVTQFKAMYAENLVIYHTAITKLPILEEAGPFAEMYYEDGKKALIFAARSMSYFGKDGTTFEKFKGNLVKSL